MNITIIGGGGFLGRKIADSLAATGKLGYRSVTSLTLFDLAPPAPLAARFPVHCVGGDGNRFSDLSISGNPSTAKVVVDGASAPNTTVIDCATAAETQVTGDNRQTVVDIPTPTQAGP